MLQQTRVDQAKPYFERFISAFPTVIHLADASIDDILLLWEGLGYYSRARNLHKAARQIRDQYSGVLPSDYTALRSLPGIGPYTAAAIMSIAFREPFGVLDGNVIRVLTRLSCVGSDSASAHTRRTLQEHADLLVSKTAPGAHNQAMMELGATCCTPLNPACQDCPVQSHCCAFAANSMDKYPVKKKKKPVPHHTIVAGLLKNDEERYLIRRRPEDVMLGGLWEFPNTRVEEGEAMEAACLQYFQESLHIEAGIEGPFQTLSHAYSHFKITVHSFHCFLVEPRSNDLHASDTMKWIALDELDAFAFHRAHRRLIDHLRDTSRNPGLFTSF